MADYNLGKATGEIELTYKDKGSKQAQADLTGVGKSADKAGISGDKAAKVLAGGGALIAGGIALAVKSAATFEQRLSAIKAVSGGTAGEMEKVRAKALQIGKDTSFSATEAAQAMEELSKAGVSTSDILSGAADATVALAAAGEIALPEAAEIASNAMNQFSLKAKDLPNVADKIAGAANASAISVSEFGQSMSQVGAVANLAGVSFDDTAVAIAELGNAGIKGSDAGTSLKTMFANLQPSTDKAKATFEELGLITEDGTNKFYDQTGKLKSLRDVQQTLQDSLKGMTAKQKQAALQTLFGSDAIRAAAVLSKSGADGYDKLSTAMGKVKAADVAATKMDNLKGSVEQLKGSAETLGIQLGTVLLPFIRNIVDSANTLVGAFASLSPETQKLIVYIAAGAASLLLFSAGLIKVVQFGTKFAETIRILSGLRVIGPILMGLRTAFTVVTTAVKAFTIALATNPIALIIIAIIALVVAIVLLWKNSETFRNIVTAAWNGVKAAIGAVYDWFMGTVLPGIQSVVSAIVGFFQGLWAAVTTTWNGILTVISTVITAISTFITNFIASVTSIWSAFWNGIFGQIIIAVFTLIRLTIELVLVAIVVLITQAINGILVVWTAVWNAVSAVIQAVWGFIKPYVLGAINAVKSGITTAINAIKSVMTTVWNTIKSVTSTVWNAIKSVISAAIGVVRTIVTREVNGVKNMVSTAWNAVKSITTSVWNSGVVGAIRNAVRTVVATVRNLIGTVRNLFSGAAGWLVNAGRNIIQGLLNGINGMIDKVRGALDNLTGLIPDWKGPASRDKILLEQNGELIMKGLIHGLESQVAPLRSMLRGVTSDIPNTFADPRLAVGNISVQPDFSALAAAGNGPAVTVNNYNPIAEPDSVSTTKAMTRLAQLGALG